MVNVENYKVKLSEGKPLESNEIEDILSYQEELKKWGRIDEETEQLMEERCQLLKMHFENKVSKDLGKKFKTPDYSSLVKYLIDNDYYTENEKDIESNAIFAIQQKAILDYGKEYLPKMGPLTEESWKRIGEKYRKRFEEEGD